MALFLLYQGFEALKHFKYQKSQPRCGAGFFVYAPVWGWLMIISVLLKCLWPRSIVQTGLRLPRHLLSEVDK